MHDPAYPESLPAAPLVRYTYTEAGELLAVHDRSNTQGRAFTYDAQHPAVWWRTVMQVQAADALPLRRCGAVVVVMYRVGLELPASAPTGPHHRQHASQWCEALHTEGGAGLKRVVKELADGRSRQRVWLRGGGSRRRRTRRDGGQSTSLCGVQRDPRTSPRRTGGRRNFARQPREPADGGGVPGRAGEPPEQDEPAGRYRRHRAAGRQYATRP
ncbi:hypothetical protein ACLK15_02825 [Escherichia coli]